MNTVNEELQNRNDELLRANSDLMNLLTSVQVAIVIVSNDLTIRRFTPMAERVLNLIPADVGRPISHIKPNLVLSDLEGMIRRVIDEIATAEREVEDREGRSFLLRARPYKNVENQIDGAVLSLFEVTSAKRQEREQGLAREYAEAIVDAIDEPFAVLDEELRVLTVNRAFVSFFGLDEPAARGVHFHDLVDASWGGTDLRRAAAELWADESSEREREIPVDLPAVGRRRLRLTVAAVKRKPGGRRFILLTVLPVTQGVTPA